MEENSYTLILHENRPSWVEYFMSLARLAATRSTCLRRHVGAVAVSPEGKRVLATGYNGAPSGLSHCTSETCYKYKNNIASKDGLNIPCKALHAEQNLILQAATTNISLKGSIVFCTHRPCSTCSKLLIGLKVEKVIYAEYYPDDYVEKLWNEYGDGTCVQLTDEYLTWVRENASDVWY